MQDRLDLITYPILCNGYNFSLAFPHFLAILLIVMNFMNIQMRYQVSQRQLGPEITSFMDFSAILHVFIKINEYAN